MIQRSQLIIAFRFIRPNVDSLTFIPFLALMSMCIKEDQIGLWMQIESTICLFCAY